MRGCRRPIVAWVAAACLVLSLGGAPGPVAGAWSQEEYQVKAAFLLNFLKYVEWPVRAVPSASDPFVVVLVGDRGAEQIEAWLGGRTALSRPIVVRRARRASDIGTCHLLFVAADARMELATALGQVAGRPSLSVSEVEEASTTDAAVNLALVEGRVTFSVNLVAVTQAGLQLSSKLLALARTVRPDGRTKR